MEQTLNCQKQLGIDIKEANKAISLILEGLKEKYNIEGVEFAITNTSPAYIGLNIDMESEAYKSYFNGSII